LRTSKTLIDKLRGDVGQNRSLLLDGGDLWQGSGLANTMLGADMVEAANLLGIEAMTGHWEFTYGEKALRDNLSRFKGEFLAQNVFLTEEAAFNDAKAFDPASAACFKPSYDQGDRRASRGRDRPGFPYVPIAHPKRFTPDWTFGIRDEELQKLVDGLRNTDKVDAVILLSHNGMDVDLKLASRVTGIDVILGGHTHDAVPQTGRGEQCRRRHAGHQCRLERQVPRRARSRHRQGQGRRRALSPAAGVLRTVEAGRGDAGADRQDAAPYAIGL
jgi:sulfur-oxidizing protein SoxB